MNEWVFFCLLFVEMGICTLFVLDFLDLNLIWGICKGCFSVLFVFLFSAKPSFDFPGIDLRDCDGWCGV